jgi:hypothetical protein
MGRYANRFENNGSVSVGTTFTSAAGGINTKFAVVGNGQVLSRAQYPALSQYYSGQTPFTAIQNISTGYLNQGTTPLSAEWTRAQTTNGLVAAETTGCIVYAQDITYNDGSNSPYGTAIWQSQSGKSWKLARVFNGPFFDVGVQAVNNIIFLCTTGGLYRSTDGIDYTQVYTGLVTNVASDGTNYVLSTGGTSGLRTSNFVDYTGISFSGLTAKFVVFYSGNYYAFEQYATGVRFSTNSGTTWTSPTSGLAREFGTSAAVMGPHLVCSTSGSGGALFQYSTNPTGTSSTWTNSTTTWQTDHGFITHYLYDSGNYIISVKRTPTGGNASTGIFGYSYTGLTATGLSFSIPLSQLSGLTGADQYGWTTTFAVATGSIKTFNIGHGCSYQPTGANWSGATTLSVGITSGVIPNPFFQQSYLRQQAATAISGIRYLSKIGAGTLNTLNNLFSIYVERSGYFNLLETSGAQRTISGFINTNNFYSNVVLIATGNSYTWCTSFTGSSPSGYVFGTHPNTNYIATATGFTNFISSFSGLIGPTSDRIYVMNVRNAGTDPSGNGTGCTIVPGATGISTPFGWTFPTGNQAASVQFSLVDDTVVICGNTFSGSNQAQWSPYLIRLQSGQVSAYTTGLTIINQTGATITSGNAIFESGVNIVSLKNGTYLFGKGGSNMLTGIYKLDTTQRIFTYLEDYRPIDTNMLSRTYLKVSETEVLGDNVISDNLPSDIVITNLNPAGAGSGSHLISTQYFYVDSGTSSYRVTTSSVNDYAKTFISRIGATGFIVPTISTTVTGEIKYIVAR